MPRRPLLLFPIPHIADRTTKQYFPPKIHNPSLANQGQRLSPIFKELQEAYNSRRIEIQQNAAGIEPEEVLIIETIGSIESFANAVKHIDGLEWMGEVEIDEIIPDENFYDESDHEKTLNGKLYLVMTNQRALNEMLSLWKRYYENPNMKFDRGLTKFRDVFLFLKNIRRWNVEDRLIETGIIDIWKERLQFNDQEQILFEAELWFRSNSALRTSSYNIVEKLIDQLGGKILSQSIIEDIAYHGLLAKLPVNAIQQIIDNKSTELVKCENIMFFRPVGQMVVGEKPLDGEIEISTPTLEEIREPLRDPIIALFDGLPLSNHSLLTGRLLIDDPDQWEIGYMASERIHGTSMASLIVHGDLNESSIAKPLSRLLYVRPIMKPQDSFMSRPEGIPENNLAIDLLHRAVKRLFDSEQDEAPVAPQIRIINLSIGDKSRQFTYAMSPLSRLLDWLSVKYNILFIVSAGNHPIPISLDVQKAQYDTFEIKELEATTVKALYRDIRHRKILSPAETINGLTIGAAHYDRSVNTYRQDQINPFSKILPSPISGFGSGYRRAIKPDLIFFGGQQLYRLPAIPQNQIILEPAIYRSAPGNKVAFPGMQGELNATSYSCGTSNATALISRAAGICYDSLEQILNEQLSDIDESTLRSYEIPLLKSMLVHGCSWGDISSRIFEIIQNPNNSRRLKGLASTWMGYGIPIVDRVLECTEQRATLLGFGQLVDGKAHIFTLPLPPSLSSRSEWRRMTVTLSWLSPIMPSTQKYRVASLWFEVEGMNITPNRKDADWNAVRRGTVQHEVFEGQSAEPFVDGNAVKIKINCRKDAGNIQNAIAYGLVVSLEVADGVNIAIYNEIQTRIRPAVEISARV